MRERDSDGRRPAPGAFGTTRSTDEPRFMENLRDALLRLGVTRGVTA
jgi:hypothetical protein